MKWKQNIVKNSDLIYTHHQDSVICCDLEEKTLSFWDPVTKEENKNNLNKTLFIHTGTIWKVGISSLRKYEPQLFYDCSKNAVIIEW